MAYSTCIGAPHSFPSSYLHLSLVLVFDYDEDLALLQLLLLLLFEVGRLVLQLLLLLLWVPGGVALVHGCCLAESLPGPLMSSGTCPMPIDGDDRCNDSVGSYVTY